MSAFKRWLFALLGALFILVILMWFVGFAAEQRRIGREQARLHWISPDIPTIG